MATLSTTAASTSITEFLKGGPGRTPGSPSCSSSEIAAKWFQCAWVFDTWFLDLPETDEFWGLGGPGGPKNHSKGWRASPPIFWNGFWDRRGPQTPKNLRFPAGSKTMY